MTRVRAECGALVQKVDKDAKPSPSKTFKANAKKFYEEDQRQLQRVGVTAAGGRARARSSSTSRSS